VAFGPLSEDMNELVPAEKREQVVIGSDRQIQIVSSMALAACEKQ
jgi:hypothetical protein